MPPSSFSKRSLFPTNMTLGAERIPRWGCGPCLVQGPRGTVTREGGAGWGRWSGVPGPIRTRGAPGARTLGSPALGAAPPGELCTGGRSLQGSQGAQGCRDCPRGCPRSAITARLSPLSFTLHPPGPGRAPPPGSPGSVRGRHLLSLGLRGGNAAAVAGWAAGGGSQRSSGAFAAGRDAALACARLPRPPLRSGARRGMRCRPRAGERPAPQPPGSPRPPAPRVPRSPR